MSKLGGIVSDVRNLKLSTLNQGQPQLDFFTGYKNPIFLGV